jgi:hypothetical protein
MTIGGGALRLTVSVGDARTSLNGDLPTFVILGPGGERSEALGDPRIHAVTATQAADG